MKDCIDRDVNVGDRVGVAFSYSRASVGYIRIGTVESLEPEFRMRWENNRNVKPVSPPMVYDSHRIVLLTPAP